MTELSKNAQVPQCDKTAVMQSVFILRDTECNSKVFGVCEICGKDAVQVYHQKRYEKTQNPITGKDYNKFITDCYGHYECLIKIR